jgi:hypothetical protein
VAVVSGGILVLVGLAAAVRRFPELDRYRSPIVAATEPVA